MYMYMRVYICALPEFVGMQVFDQYGWTIVSTIVPTDKKSREYDLIPFLKLSNGARNGVKRGWYREAVLK